jgi:hypothetical protein
VELSQPDGTPIKKWEEWTRPKRSYHWKPGRSAMELARAWFKHDRINIPKEVIGILSSHDRLKGFNFSKGIPEFVTPLPERGEGRNHDLYINGTTSNESFTLCIEAKADEPFGNQSVAEYYLSAIRKRQHGVKTKAPDRINTLLSFVGENNFDTKKSAWSGVRYQLLTAICGTAIQATKDSSTLGILVIHEFQTDNTTKDNLKRNAHDFEFFMRVFLNAPEFTIKPGNLVGPIKVDGIDCLIGKISSIVQ